MTFFVFEGLSCSGKTTVINKLADLLKSSSQEVCVTSGVYKDDLCLGHQINSHLNKPDIDITSSEFTDLILSNRVLHYKEVIAPALKAGKIILCDRWYASTFVYQKPKTHSYAFKEKIKSSMRILENRHQGYITPTKTFFLDVSRETMESRLAHRGAYTLPKDLHNWVNYDLLKSNYLTYINEHRQTQDIEKIDADMKIEDILGLIIELITPSIVITRPLGRCI
jgi:dTMP kinase